MAALGRRTIQQRFDAKWCPEPMSGCWLWTAGVQGGRDGKTYGKFGVNGHSLLAHRFSYELSVGPIPAGLTIDHLCRVTLCVNHDHLEPVTMAINLQRAFDVANPGRNRPDVIPVGFALTHCRKAGHEFTPDNSLWHTRAVGGSHGSHGVERVCRQCWAEKSRLVRLKRAERKALAAKGTRIGDPSRAVAL